MSGGGVGLAIDVLEVAVGAATTHEAKPSTAVRRGRKLCFVGEGKDSIGARVEGGRRGGDEDSWGSASSLLLSSRRP